jgi:predicted HAD superfamily Cof-like phosphohydrolase
MALSTLHITDHMFFYRRVKTFMTCANQLEQSVLNIMTDPVSLFKFRCDLLHEEIEETINAITVSGAIIDVKAPEIIDGVCDMLYIAYGTWVAYSEGGMPDRKQVIEKICAYDLIAPQYDYNSGVSEYVLSVLKKYSKMASEYHPNTHDYFITTIHYLFDLMCHGYNRVSDTPMLSVLLYYFFDIVHASNMTKFNYNTDDQKLTEKKYLESSGIIPACRIVTISDVDYYVTYNSETGKILKSINFKHPEFKLPDDDTIWALQKNLRPTIKM